MQTRTQNRAPIDGRVRGAGIRTGVVWPDSLTYGPPPPPPPPPIFFPPVLNFLPLQSNPPPLNSFSGMAKKERRRQVSNSKPSGPRNPRRDSKEDGKPGENACAGRACSCVASFTADCAAVCCCPCALLHLLFLAFVKLPAAFAAKAFRRAVRSSEKSALDIVTADKSRSAEPCRMSLSWSGEESPEPSGRMPSFEGFPGEKFDTQKVWSELYAAGRMGFGGLPLVSGD